MSKMNKMIPEDDQLTEKDMTDQDPMRDEYDFSDGVRGKHYQAYRQGHAVKIHQTDGEVLVQYFTLEEGAVFIEPDVRVHFPDAEAVNHALRGLIALFPEEAVSHKKEAKESS
jgi:hypothetical protein